MRASTIIAVLVLSSSFACGRTIRVANDHPDPDTLDAIKNSNTEVLSGEWALGKGREQLYFKFEADSYIALGWQNGELRVSDQGFIEHLMPGTVLLRSTNANCSVGSRNYFEVNFDLKSSNAESLLLLDARRKLSLRFPRTHMAEIPPLGACLWDGVPEQGFNIN